MPYVIDTINSILCCDSTDFELIVSDDNSQDGTFEYVSTLSDSRLRVFRPDTKLSLSEHWEFALSKSSGEWRMFIGQDDAIQTYFFNHANNITKLALEKGIRAVCSRRAYLFWPGCEEDYPFRAHFYAADSISIQKSLYSTINSLFGQRPYHELPQMYTNSIFHESLISEARLLQGGRVFISHPQDSNLAAIALTLDTKFLRTEVPFGWVGTSPSSAGLAISRQAEGKASNAESLAKDYHSGVSNSTIEYPGYAGSFGFGDTSIYFWQALRQTSHYLGDRYAFLNNRLISWVFLTLVWSKILSRRSRFEKKKAFREILKANGFGFLSISSASLAIRGVFAFMSLIRQVAMFLVTKSSTTNFGPMQGFNVLASNSKDLDLKKMNEKASDIYNHMYGAK
jgi:glycosyltransferase involved in cell wall biosynthesis